MSFNGELSWQKRSFAFEPDDRFQHSTKRVQDECCQPNDSLICLANV